MEEEIKKLVARVEELERRVQELEEEARFTKEYTSAYSGTQGQANKSI